MRSFGFVVLMVVAAVLLASANAEAPDPSVAALEKLANVDLPLNLRFSDATLYNVMQAVAQSGGFKLVGRGEWPTNKLSLVWNGTTIRGALTRLAKEQVLEYEVPSAHKLIVVLPKKQATGR